MTPAPKPSPLTLASTHPTPPIVSPRAQELTLTVRHLPTDRWLTLSVPREWRISQLKRVALEAFGELASETGQVEVGPSGVSGGDQEEEEMDREGEGGAEDKSGRRSSLGAFRRKRSRKKDKESEAGAGEDGQDKQGRVKQAAGKLRARVSEK
ncbi:hypothetical protein JCM10207_001199, partial [Rhodosporidiobolus poonsookiae]